MSFIQNFFTSRDNNANAATYVGQQDRLWYNPITQTLYVSDGTTPGGLPLNLATGANIVANNVSLNTITARTGTVSVVGNIYLTGSANIVGNISPAEPNKVGGIQPGPGVVIANDGTLTIDTANLPLSFGNFTASNNILSIVNVDEDMILETQGNAEIQLIGNIGFYQNDGGTPTGQYFKASKDGQIFIYVPTTDSTFGAVEIIGTTTGCVIAPGIDGAMLHITGQLDQDCRLYFDGNGGYVAINNRAWNGNILTGIQAIQAGDDVLRLNATAATSTGMGNVAFAQIRYTAIENQTPTAQGSNINFWTTAAGTAANSRVEVANISVANGVTATKFTTSGNITGGNLNLTGNIVADYVQANNFGNIGNVEIESGSTYWYFNTNNSFTGTGNISVTGNVSAGNVNSYVTLSAGTTTKAPLVFTAGSLLNTSIPGAMNYDGVIFYASPQNQERGLIKTPQIYLLNTDYTLTNQTAVQSMFGVSVSLSSNTRYTYTINAVIYKTANNITMSYATDGNVTLARHTYQTITTATAALATATTPTAVKNIITTGFTAPVIVTAALNGTGYYSIQATGTVNVTTGGTWNPLVAFSGLPGTGSYVAAGSSVEIYPIGPANATINIGTWA